MYCHNLTWLTHVTCKRALFCFCYHSSFNFMIYLKSVWINWLFVPNERQMWCQCSVMVMMMPIWGVMVFICRQSETARPRACHSLYNASTLLHTARSATHCTMTLHTTQLIITLHGDWLHCIVQQCVQTGRHTVLLSHSVQLHSAVDFTEVHFTLHTACLSRALQLWTDFPAMILLFKLHCTVGPTV